MYYLANRIVAAVLIIMIIMLWRIIRRKSVRKNLCGVLIFAFLSLFCLAVLIVQPMRVFIRSESPEKIYHLISFDKVVQTIPGQESCLIVAKEGTGDYVNTYLPCDERGYVLPANNTAKIVFNSLSEPSMTVVNIDNTSDYYLCGMGVYPSETLTVSNSLGSQFYFVDSSTDPIDGKIYGTFIYYAYLNSFDDDYCITINGETYPLTHEEGRARN